MTIKAVYRHAQDGHLLETWDYDVRCHTYVRYAIGYIALIIKPYLDVERLGVPVVLFCDLHPEPPMALDLFFCFPTNDSCTHISLLKA